MKKRVCLIILFLIFFLTTINVCYASIVDELDMEGVSNVDIEDSSTGILGAINTIIGLLQYVGSGIALIIITILGIKYILASPAEKADVKKSIMPILIGCVLLFGGVNIAGLIVTFTNGATGDAGGDG